LCFVRTPILPVLALSAATLAGGCTAGDGRSSTFPDAATRRARAIHPVEVMASGPGAQLTHVTALDADSRGRIYVADMFQPSVLVLSPDGRVLRRIGHRGAGPGEFRSVRDVQVLPGDSLLVYDANLVRVSVFAPDSGRPAYVVNLAERLPGAPPFHLARAPATGGYLAQFQAWLAFGPGNALEPRRDSLVLLGPDGTPRAWVATFAAAPFLVARTSVTPHPFGRRAVARLDSRGRILFAWTDSLAVTIYSASGERRGGFGYRYAPPAITRGDVRAALDAMGQSRQLFENVLDDSLPERWPALQDLRVDDRDRLWIRLSGPADQLAEWAVFAADGRYTRSVLLPPRTTLHAVRSGRVYADRVDSAGVPRVVGFELRQQP
jgi:hypothetical protein